MINAFSKDINFFWLFVAYSGRKNLRVSKNEPMRFPPAQQLRIEYLANIVARIGQLAHMHVALDNKLVPLKQLLRTPIIVYEVTMMVMVMIMVIMVIARCHRCGCHRSRQQIAARLAAVQAIVQDEIVVQTQTAVYVVQRGHHLVAAATTVFVVVIIAATAGYNGIELIFEVVQVGGQLEIRRVVLLEFDQITLLRTIRGVDFVTNFALRRQIGQVWRGPVYYIRAEQIQALRTAHFSGYIDRTGRGGDWRNLFC